MAINETRFEALMGGLVSELGAALGVPLHRIGDDLGIWRAMADGAPRTAEELASCTGCAARYLREWLSAETAAGYVDHEPSTDRFSISEEVAFVMADDTSPAYLGGAWQVTSAVYESLPEVTRAFQTGGGVAWSDHGHDLFEGVERFFRPGYNAHLVQEWLPALDGVTDKLTGGARVADVGCGHGASTVIMASAFPESTFVGFDSHDASIVAARKAAASAGVADRVSFEVCPAQSYPGTDYDLVTVFDALHDMGDPEAAARHVRSSLADDGTWLLVEPFANETLAKNVNPVGRLFLATSTLVCLPASLADNGSRGLGNQVSDGDWAAITAAAGFTRMRRAAETPFNRVFEVRP